MTETIFSVAMTANRASSNLKKANLPIFGESKKTAEKSDPWYSCYEVIPKEELGSVFSLKGLKKRTKLGFNNSVTYIKKTWNNGKLGKFLVASEALLFAVSALTLFPMIFLLPFLSSTADTFMRGFIGGKKLIIPDKTEKVTQKHANKG